jgi:hypothetical protein
VVGADWGRSADTATATSTPTSSKLRHLDTVAAQHIDRLREIQSQRDQLQPARERWSAWHAVHKRDLDRLTSLNLAVGVAEAVRDRYPSNRPRLPRTTSESNPGPRPPAMTSTIVYTTVET